MNRAAPELTDMRHTKVCYSKERFCAHTSQYVIGNFGNGEIVVMHAHAPCTYAYRLSLGHGLFQKRGVFLPQRSLDHGETWDREHDVVVWNNTMSDREKTAIYSRADEPGVVREEIDLTSPDSLVFFKRSSRGGRRPGRTHDYRELCLPLGRSWPQLGRGAYPRSSRY